MAQIITYQDRTALGTFCQLKLDDGNRILISITQTEVAIFKMRFMGMMPGDAIFKSAAAKLVKAMIYNRPSYGVGGSFLEALVRMAADSPTMDQVKNSFTLLMSEPIAESA